MKKSGLSLWNVLIQLMFIKLLKDPACWAQISMQDIYPGSSYLVREARPILRVNKYVRPLLILLEMKSVSFCLLNFPDWKKALYFHALALGLGTENPMKPY